MEIHTSGKNLIAVSPWPGEGLLKCCEKLHCIAVFSTVQLSLTHIVLPSPYKALQLLCLRLLYKSNYKESYSRALSILQSMKVTIIFSF